MEYIIAFAVGGGICGLVQVLMDQTKLQPGRIMVLLVCSGAVLSAVGLYVPFKEWAGAGASVPLTGFGYSLAKGVKEAIEQDGFIGILTGGLKATAGGIAAAITAGLIVSILFRDKDKT